MSPDWISSCRIFDYALMHTRYEFPHYSRLNALDNKEKFNFDPERLDTAKLRPYNQLNRPYNQLNRLNM